VSQIILRDSDFDRYARLWPTERFRAHDIAYEPAEKPKSDLYRDMLPLLNARRIEGDLACRPGERLANHFDTVLLILIVGSDFLEHFAGAQERDAAARQDAFSPWASYLNLFPSHSEHGK
jgi:hypothetical protein